jgi:hypothetical protein
MSKKKKNVLEHQLPFCNRVAAALICQIVEEMSKKKEYS